MNTTELEIVKDYVKGLADRMTKAKQAINNLNFGLARAILEEPLPTLELNATAGSDLGDGESATVVTILDTKKDKKSKNKAVVSTLDIPFSGAEFLEAWGRLLSTKEWHKKTVSQLQWNLDRLSKYPEEFATLLVNEAFNGGRNGTFMGVVFESTPAKYTRWLANHGNPNINIGGIPMPGEVKQSKVLTAAQETVRAFEQIDTLFNKEQIDDEQ